MIASKEWRFNFWIFGLGQDLFVGFKVKIFLRCIKKMIGFKLFGSTRP
jgi:hypothetical protein